MPCLIGCLAMGLPRLTVFALWLFSDWFVPVFKSNLWFFLGFLFMPMTTLAYGWSWHRGQGEHDGLGITVIVIGVAFDLGLIRIGRPRRRRMGGGGGDGGNDGGSGGGGVREILVSGEKVG